MRLGLILGKRKMTLKSWVSINNSVSAETFWVPCLAGRDHIAPLFLRNEDPVHERSCRLHLQHLSKTEFCHHLHTTLIQAMVVIHYGNHNIPTLWPPDAKSWLIWKDPGAGKDWGQEEKGTTDDEMVGWHHWCQWTWVWVGSGSWCWTGRPGVLRFMGSQRIRHDWATELNWTLPAPFRLSKPKMSPEIAMCLLGGKIVLSWEPLI